MRVSKEHKERMKSKILAAAGKAFRKIGYGNIGVDGISREAGVTSGAFYGHFSSKEEAFKESIAKGFSDYSNLLNKFRELYGQDWVNSFLEYYLGKEHRRNLSESCVVPSLSAEVMRSSKEVKKVYTKGMNGFIESFLDGVDSDNRENAWALMSILAGSVLLSRSVSDTKLADEISQSAKAWADKIVAAKS